MGHSARARAQEITSGGEHWSTLGHVVEVGGGGGEGRGLKPASRDTEAMRTRARQGHLPGDSAWLANSGHWSGVYRARGWGLGRRKLRQDPLCALTVALLEVQYCS